MKHSKYQYFSGRRFLAVLSALVLALGFGLSTSSKALAREDDRFVVIRGGEYSVRHDGNGPYISLGGNRYYLEGDGSDRFVVVSGVRYDVDGDRHHEHHRNHHGDRHHRHHRHKD